MGRLAVGVVCAILAGCASKGDQKKDAPLSPFADQAPDVFKKGERSGRDPAKTQDGGKIGPREIGEAPAWTIVIISAPEEDVARQLLDRVRGAGGLADARLEKRGPVWSVVTGRYDSATSGEAQRDLKRVRTMVVEGGTPFERAVLGPPVLGNTEGGNPEWDLSRVRGARGRDALYTLQVAIYKRLDNKSPSANELAEFRSAAEKAVGQFRGEGEEAYYYHGPQSSTVTVGVYGPDDYDLQGPRSADSPAIQAARQKHPLNLVNGQGYRERRAGEKSWRMQPSFIVVIPER